MNTKPSPCDNHGAVDPKSLLAAFCCACVCATVCILVLALRGPRIGTPLRLWSPIVVATNGNESVLADTRQLEFWTPSAATKNYLHLENGKVVDSEKWQVLSNDDAVVQFGSVIRSNASVLGYRRVEEWGQGRSSFKPGWWWTVNVVTNYSAATLGRAYQDYWKTKQAVFIEVIDNRGRNE